ncbi:MAG: phosphopantetheine-binding protein [Gammaproteobacteria bacterium]|nr:phosphopantetheine-binding protein [Gammaproteobacteria bacterium]
MLAIKQVLEVLAESLPLPEVTYEMGEQAPLLGAIPELDSMAITSIISALEERFEIAFDDEDLDAEAFQTVGTLRDLIASKMQH